MGDTELKSRANPEHFFGTLLPRQFQERLGDLERKISRIARELDDLRALRATLRVRLEGSEGGEYFLNFADGRLQAGSEALEPPFVAIHQSVEDWRSAVERDGARSFGLMGGDFGPTGLRADRLARVRALRGSLRVVLTALPGTDPDKTWTVTACFGDAAPEPPTTTMSMGYNVAEELRQGNLNPQQAFMAGKLRLSGDMGFAMQLGTLML